MPSYEWLTDFHKDMYVSKGYQLSKTYDEESEAMNYISYLRQLGLDPSYSVSIAGLYAHLDHYPQVIYKVTSIYS